VIAHDPSLHGLCRRLSGYLCGTHSGLWRLGKPGGGRSPLSTEEIASAHRQVRIERPAGDPAELGGRQWKPREQAKLAHDLNRSLANADVVDLILYGSQARTDRTGFSDIDAILVIRDEAADDAAVLRSLRPNVIAAQRAILRYQAMQHHGFDVSTPRLLTRATEALGLPAVALTETCSLRGTVVNAFLTNSLPDDANNLRRLSESLRALASWPSHPWRAHRAIAMFELLPTLYLQARDVWVPKSMSFAEVGRQFETAWWPYEVLEEIRRRWPRRRYRRLDSAVYVLRNPWAGVAVWRHLPEVIPKEVHALLTPGLLTGLHSVMRRLQERAT
jgi:hypothetical protein